ncbi:MAG: hypothetical protein IH859_10210 [Chloroflexi bacterium]|nr:hypothetical protein [Chloroflexota bacterium]
MKKLFLTIIALAIINFEEAQTIQSGSGSTTGYIKSDGTIQNSSYSTVGYIKSDGTIQNSSRRMIILRFRTIFLLSEGGCVF